MGKPVPDSGADCALHNAGGNAVNNSGVWGCSGQIIVSPSVAFEQVAC